MTTPRIEDWWLHEDRTVNGVFYKGVTRYHTRTMAPKAIFIHIQEGSNFGSWQHFHSVLASSTVMISKQGVVWRLVPENKAPWTNGDVKSPTQKGLQLLNTYGWDPNSYSLTIELEGFTGQAVPDAQMQALVWQVKTWMQQYDIPLSRVYRHADVNTVTRPRCPGDALFNALINNVARGAGIPKTETVVSFAKPMIPMVNGKAWDGLSDVTISGTKFYARKQIVKTSGVVNRRQWASSTSNPTGVSYAASTTFHVLGWVNGEEVDGERRWWVGANGDRVWAGGTVEKPNAERPKATPDQDGNPLTPVVVNGVVFYPVTTKYKLTAETNMRQWATTDSKVIGTLLEGEVISPAYRCKGENVNGVDDWFVTKPKDAKLSVFHSGPRVWSGTAVLAG